MSLRSRSISFLPRSFVHEHLVLGLPRRAGHILVSTEGFDLNARHVLAREVVSVGSSALFFLIELESAHDPGRPTTLKHKLHVRTNRRVYLVVARPPLAGLTGP